jgi:Resolvase, N terminal domain
LFSSWALPIYRKLLKTCGLAPLRGRFANFLPPPHPKRPEPAARDKAVRTTLGFARFPGATAMTVRAYVRVSTADQNCELQVRELCQYAERQGWQIAEIYQDVSSSTRVSRPALSRLMLAARARSSIASWYGNWTVLAARSWTA